MVKLNLGCGIFYKPGYVNIDKYESLIADQVLDVMQLPYEENSVDEIEASHILEHFDSLHVPYVLSEWFRILKPGGLLFLETPHLVKTTRKVHHGPVMKQVNTLRFLFGIDIQGNIHKMGFTPAILKKILLSIGFCNITKLHSQRFTSEKGLRIKAEKPTLLSKSSKITFIMNLRNKIATSIQNPGSLFLEAVENNLILPLSGLLPKNIDDYFNPANNVKLLANAALLTPQVALIFSTILEKEKMEGIQLEVLHFLHDHDAPSLFLGNWSHWKKTPVHLFISLRMFYIHWSKKIQQSMGMGGFNERDFQYLLTGGAEHVDYFSPEVISFKTIKSFNLGVKAFSRQEFDNALAHFLNTLKFDPSNALGYWNLARLFNHFHTSREKVQGYYYLAIKLIKKSKFRRIIKKELEGFIATGACPLLPVQM